MQQQQQPYTTITTTSTTVIGSTSAEAPPKQVASAMERLGEAGRVIADIRLGADRLLEALFMAAETYQSSRPLQFFLNEDASMRQHFHNLRSIGRQLEECGVLNDELRKRTNSWGLHMPLVCPDGAVVAYAWKRQLAGQAGAFAVDRTRLALKAFSDQKRRFFPHLVDGLDNQSDGPLSKKPSVLSSLSTHNQELLDCKTLSEVLMSLEKKVSDLKIFTYERLDWLKRASSLPKNESAVETVKDRSFHSSSKLRTNSSDAMIDKVAVIELLFPSVFRAVVSLHPAGSMDPDAVAFFSPEEGGSYIHARGFSVYHVFKHITEHASLALQYFLGVQAETALYFLLLWICSYQTLFTKVCSKCGRLLSMDRRSALLLPPVSRPYQQFSTSNITSSLNFTETYHVGCFVEEK